MMKYRVGPDGSDRLSNASRGKELWQYRTSVLYRTFRNCSALGVTDAAWLMKGFKLKNIKELREHVVPVRASTEEIQNHSELQSGLCGDCGHVIRVSKSALQ